MKLFDRENRIDEILLAIFVKAGTGTPLHKNRASHGLSYNLSGSKIYSFLNGVDIKTKAHELIYLPKGSDYVVKIIEPGDCYAINFNTDSNMPFEPQNFNCDNFTLIHNIFDTSKKLWMIKPAGYEYKLKSLLYELFYLIKKQQSESMNDKNYLKIKTAMDYIAKNYTDPSLNIAMLSNLCNISDTYFRKAFKGYYNCTPLKYINEKRLELAKHLIASNLYSIKEIVDLCGFSDVCVFSRVFKSRFGCPPTAYGKKVNPNCCDEIYKKV